MAALTITALGVVYGDIGTSPLYALKECFHGPHAIAVTPTNVMGVLSLIFWSLMVVITIKYVCFVTKADDQGEGGTFALLALLRNAIKRSPRNRFFQALPYLALCSAALLYSDGIITPAISVLSAVEGLNVVTPAASNMPPAATTGMLTLRAISGQSTIEVSSPMCPPASQPSAMTKSAPMRSISIASARLATTGATTQPASFQRLT